jgi:hypothetical protein
VPQSFNHVFYLFLTGIRTISNINQADRRRVSIEDMAIFTGVHTMCLFRSQELNLCFLKRCLILKTITGEFQLKRECSDGVHSKEVHLLNFAAAPRPTLHEPPSQNLIRRVCLNFMFPLSGVCFVSQPGKRET